MDPTDPNPVIPSVTPPTEGLVAHWTFDNMTATGAMSVVSSDEAVCAAGECATTVAGVAGVAARFDGANTCYRVPSLAGLDTSSYTVSLWANLDTTSIDQPMMMRYETGCSSPSVRSHGAETGHAAYDINEDHQYAWTGATLAPQQWQQIAIRWDGLNQSIFVDGVCACNNQPAFALIMAVSNEFTIGCDDNDGKRLSGSLDEIRIYDHALANDEMAALATEGGRPAPMPVACPTQCTVTSDFP